MRAATSEPSPRGSEVEIKKYESVNNNQACEQNVCFQMRPSKFKVTDAPPDLSVLTFPNSFRCLISPPRRVSTNTTGALGHVIVLR